MLRYNISTIKRNHHERIIVIEKREKPSSRLSNSQTTREGICHL